jgi:hypothetical protein
MNAVDSWSVDVWKQINGQPAQNGQPMQPGQLKTVMGKIRVAQQVFGATVRGNDNPIPADTIDLKTGIPSAGLTKPVVTMTKTFQLQDIHIKDPTLTMVMNQVTLAGQDLGLIEETLFYQGQKARIPASIKVSNVADLGDGLLGKAIEINAAIPVAPPNPKNPGVYGTATYAAVTKGISVFTASLQGPPYALLLDPTTYADAHLPLQDSAIITPASAIQSLVGDGGFAMAAGLPPSTGLLVSLAGATTKLYVGTEPIVEFRLADKDGIYYFTARQSIQFVNIDARSLIKLEFK